VKVLYPLPHHQMLKEVKPNFLFLCCPGAFAVPFTIAWFIGAVAWLYPPLRERRIMRRGVGAMGTVARKVEEKIKRGIDYVIWYRFAAANRQTYDDKASVSRAMFDQFEEGQEVVVVYMADWPNRSVLYEASDYRPR